MRTADDSEGDRRATWLELFFDLVFVAVVANLATRLVHDPSALGFLRFAALWVPCWWAWVGYTFYADRFDTDDLPHRLYVFIGMLAVAALAVTVRNAFEGGASAFAWAYVAARLPVILLNLRAHRHVESVRPMLRAYIGGFAVAAALFALSTALPRPWIYVVWPVSLAIDIGVPLLGRTRFRGASVDAAHIPERFGLFTIIVLGESVFAVVVGLTGIPLTWSVGAVSAFGFGIAAGIWWLYFDYLPTSTIQRGVRSGQIYVYGHLSLLIGLTAIGAATKLAIRGAVQPRLSAGTAWILGAGVATVLLSMAVIHLATVRSPRDRDALYRLVGASFAILVAGLHTLLSPALLVGLLALDLLVIVGLEIAAHEGHAHEHALTES